MVKFLDKATVSGAKRTQEGYLVADAYAVRTGIQQYAGYELGRPDLSVVNVYRPEGEVFAKDSVQSFSHVPVTMDHPSVPVTSANWKDLAVGEASSEVLRDGERLKIPLILKDAAAIAAVEGGKRELSAGYSADIVFEDGVAPDGTAYQAVQRNIRANHVAVVDRGRAGSEFRIGDSAVEWGAAPLTLDKDPTMTLRTLMFDGISIQVTDQAAQAIEKLQGRVGELTADNLKLVADHRVLVVAKDEEIGGLKAQLADAQKAASVDVDALVAARSLLVDTAKAFVPDLKVEGMKDADIKKAVVVAKLGDEAVKDVSDAELNGMFKAITKDSAKQTTPQVDPVRGALLGDTRSQQVNDNGYSEYVQRISGGWNASAAGK